MAAINKLPLHGVKILDLTRVLAGEIYVLPMMLYSSLI